MGSSSTDSTVAEIAVTSVKVERSKLDHLRKIAESQHRSTSAQIRFLIDRCIAEYPDLKEAS